MRYLLMFLYHVFVSESHRGQSVFSRSPCVDTSPSPPGRPPHPNTIPEGAGYGSLNHTPEDIDPFLCQSFASIADRGPTWD